MAYFVLLAVVSMLAAAPVRGDTLCVNPGGTGGCFASVQAAVDAAANSDIVTIAAGTYIENVTIGQGRRLTLEGEDAATTILDGGGSGLTLNVQGPYTSVSLARLRIQNSGPNDDDGGLGVPGATVTVTRCRITGNAGHGITGGSPRLTVVESTIDGNARTGIVGHNLKVVRSTISGNGNGGIRTVRGVVEDSTISGNTGASFGGGIFVDTRLRLVRSTVVGNSAGGVYVNLGARARAESSILANNVDGVTNRECAVAEKTLSIGPGDGVFTSAGYNLIEGECPFGHNVGLDVTGQDPLLGPLQDNGGPTATHALMPGSPALGFVARNRVCKHPDQRGVARALPCDIGAYEAP